MFRISSANERFVGSLENGEEFVDALRELCKSNKITAGEVRAVGQFSSIELVRFDEDTKSYETIVDGEGTFDLVNLNGNISMLGEEVILRLDATCNVVGPMGAQLVGGQLRKAQVVHSEFVVDSFSDLRMDRKLDAGSGRLILKEIEYVAGQKATEQAKPKPESIKTVTRKTAAASAPAAEPKREAEAPKKEQSSMSWGDAIAETEKAEKERKARLNRGGRARKGVMGSAKKTEKDPYEDLDMENPWMSPGDYLDHPKLGRCRIIKVEDDHYAHIRLPRGRIRKLALEILEVEFKGEENGTNVFQARVRR